MKKTISILMTMVLASGIAFAKGYFLGVHAFNETPFGVWTSSFETIEDPMSLGNTHLQGCWSEDELEAYIDKAIFDADLDDYEELLMVTDTMVNYRDADGNIYHMVPPTDIWAEAYAAIPVMKSIEFVNKTLNTHTENIEYIGIKQPKTNGVPSRDILKNAKKSRTIVIEK